MNKSAHAHLKQKKIMVAEDDYGISDAIEIMLTMENYKVTTTANAATLADIHKELPDLLLLDIWMSGMDGRTICKQLKKQKLTKDIPVIMISASKDVEASAREAGADDFLAKPFEMNDLLSLVAEYTKKERKN